MNIVGTILVSVFFFGFVPNTNSFRYNNVYGLSPITNTNTDTIFIF